MTDFVINQITRFLFAGEQLKSLPSTGDYQIGQGLEFKFVEAGLPYVKFQFDGQVKHYGESVSTSDNDFGKINYYMLMNNFNHLGITDVLH